MTKRLIALLAVAAALLTGCAEAVDGTPNSDAPSAFPRTTAALGAELKAGTATLKSTHLTLNEAIGSQSISGAGDETIADSKVGSLSLKLDVPGLGMLQIVRVDGKTFVKLPPAQSTSGKPWALVTTSSSNPVVRAMAGSLAAADEVTGLDAASIFIDAARDLKYLGTSSIAGASTGHYSLIVDVNRLPADYPQKQLLVTAGLTKLPVQLWVDMDGRLRKLTERLTVSGQTVNTVVTLGNFDAPVHITAPPPDHVDTH